METFENLQQLLNNSLAQLLRILADYLPNLILAVLLMLVGWLLASLIRSLILRFGSGIDHLTSRIRRHGAVSQEPLRKPLSALIARIGYWLVLVFFIAAAVEPLGLPGLADWISLLIRYLPNLFIGGLFVLLGYVLGGVAHDAINSAAQGRGVESASALSLAVQSLIIAFSVILGLGQLGLDITLLVNVVTIATAAVLGGLGLAFGLGASVHVNNILAAQHLRKIYTLGQRVRVNNIEGEILEMTGSAVILDTADGQAMVPAKVFSDHASFLLKEGSGND